MSRIKIIDKKKMAYKTYLHKWDHHIDSARKTSKNVPVYRRELCEVKEEAK